nr:MAG TPA: tail assembly chaperone protein [Caudoviricetes sp.]
MSADLYAFLNPQKPTEEKEIIISERFKDQDGNIIPFKIRAITQEENDMLAKKSRKGKKVNGIYNEQLDNTEYSRRLVVAATVFPPFDNAEICKKYDVLDPLLVPGKMLLAGEYAKLVNAIMEISDFGGLEDEVKNY